MKKLAILAVVAMSFALGACNTVRGLGQDLESAANEVDQET
ncbi:MAG: hypothetical protein ACXWUN_06800 [Allosphingosinicella sp.]